MMYERMALLTVTTHQASFYGSLAPGATDDALDNVDMQTDAGTAATTQFTRYTAAQASTRAGTVKSGYVPVVVNRMYCRCS